MNVYLMFARWFACPYYKRLEIVAKARNDN